MKMHLEIIEGETGFALHQVPLNRVDGGFHQKIHHFSDWDKLINKLDEIKRDNEPKND